MQREELLTFAISADITRGGWDAQLMRVMQTVNERLARGARIKEVRQSSAGESPTTILTVVVDYASTGQAD